MDLSEIQNSPSPLPTNSKAARKPHRDGMTRRHGKLLMICIGKDTPNFLCYTKYYRSKRLHDDVLRRPN